MNINLINFFKNGFNPRDEMHVLWLQKIQKANPLTNIEINNNPMKIQFKETDISYWNHIYSNLAISYTQSVLCGDAWIPPIEDHWPTVPTTIKQKMPNK